MTVWTSFLWMIKIHLAEKWPEIVVKWAIVIVICFYSEYMRLPAAVRRHCGAPFIWVNKNYPPPCEIANGYMAKNYTSIYNIHTYLKAERKQKVKNKNLALIETIFTFNPFYQTMQFWPIAPTIGAFNASLAFSFDFGYLYSPKLSLLGLWTFKP